MSYIILADSQKKPGEKVALVDRTKCKEHWWTENVSKAIVFTSKEAASNQCGKMKYNNPKVWEFEAGRIRLGQVAVTRHRSWLSDALDRKMTEWHDDDWYEGIND